ncbi:MAG: hypothetical protein V4549_07170 [Bacteroidota bacterium]
MKDIAKTNYKIPLGEKASRDDIACKCGFYSQFKDYLEIKGNDKINFE